MINEISIKTNALLGFSSVKTPKPNALSNVTRVNIFIGPNNSGKSRFMRGLFSDTDFSFTLKELDLSVINSAIVSLQQNSTTFINARNMQYAGNDKNPTIKILEIPYLKLDKGSNDSLAKNINAIDISSTTIRTVSNGTQSSEIQSAGKIRIIQDSLHKLKYEIEEINRVYNEYDYKRYYIPILRGLRPIQGAQSTWAEFDGLKDQYNFRTIVDYFEHQKNTIPAPEISTRIFTGLEIYQDAKTKLLNSKEHRNRIRDFEDFIEKTFFPGKEISLIPKIDHDVLEVGISENDIAEERLIHQLGDGIQAIIQILYPIFMRKGEDAIFFIEEPELSLHPGMQRLFLKTLLSEEFSSMQFFLTTHSNHFLDFTEDSNNISIYGFAKTKEGKFEIRNLEGPENHILNEIGVRNSSVLLANCSIWIEGITERKYIRSFLEVYNKAFPPKINYLEDLHFTFIEYGGSNIVHWDFDTTHKEESENIKALRTNNKIFLIADSDILDKTGEAVEHKKRKHKELKKILNDKFYLTEGKEIENMLSAKTIQNIVLDYEKGREIKFSKNFKKTISSPSFNMEGEIEKPIYWKYNLGEFIDSHIENSGRTYKKRSSVAYKLNFCEKAVKNIKSIDDLTNEAKELCKRLMKFIEESNK